MGFIVGVVLLLVLIGVLVFFGDHIYPRLLLQPARHTDHLQYLLHPFERTEFEATTTDGHQLACFYGRPEKQPPRGTYLILHGHSYSKDGMAWLAQKLTREGFAVVAFDARAHGRSEGEISTIGDLEGADAIEVIREAERRFDLPSPRIVIGQSLGAATAIRMITLPDHTMDAAILISPYARLRELVTREAGKYLWFTDTQEVMENAEKLAGREMWAFSPVDLAPGIAIPVLMIHGTRDARFPIEEGREVFGAIGSAVPQPADKHLIEADGAGHNDVLSGGMPWSEPIADGTVEFVERLAPSASAGRKQ